MIRPFLSLALAATLLAPMAAFADTTPAAPATPTPPAAAPVAAKKHSRLTGRIASLDATAKTVTLHNKKADVTVSVPDGTKIYKPGDVKGTPTGAWADLVVGTSVRATVTGDAAAPTTTEIHILAPKVAKAPVTPPATTPPATTPAAP